jgi:hypothetical protein
VTLAGLRNGVRIEKQVTLEERGGGEPRAAPASSAAPESDAWPGLELEKWSAPQDPDSEAHGLAGVRVAEVALTSPWYEQRSARRRHRERDQRPSGRERGGGAAGPRRAKPGTFVRLYVWRIGRSGNATQFFAVTQVP